MWAIGVRFLTGVCVATDAGDREQGEWPPHPARLFMALAAAYFETGEEPSERAALEWLEQQPPPDLRASEADARKVVTAFVPVNDARGQDTLPSLRSRQPRTFPAVIPRNDTLYYIWSGGSPPDEVRKGLDRLAAKVVRLGHSSSLVQAWLELDESALADYGEDHINWTPDFEGLPDVKLRTFGPGSVERLQQAYNQQPINEYAELMRRLETAKGSTRKTLNQQIQDRFDAGQPTSQRPEMKLAIGYRRKREVMPDVRATVFDDNLLILSLMEGAVLGCETTLRLTAALRGAILSQFKTPTEIPEWISGHQPDGRPSERPHLALIPLPFVGSQYADGHLLGAALVFPRDIAVRERGQALRRLLSNPDNGTPRDIDLLMGQLGEATLVRETRLRPPQALRPETWTAASRAWATATPIVLDRYPKADRSKEPSLWYAEVSDTIARACENIGLPEPVEIAINHNSYHRGVPKSRPNGGGFPLLPERKQKRGSRYQVHALLVFDEPVCGPILLGAGRYVGYGLCKPYSLPGER